MSLALKYRPKFFKDLVGQESVSQTLSLALDSQKIGNAYLFSGLRGSGKTSSARIFARSLQCDSGPSSSPCGECANCKASLEGRHIDIIEMDAASNRRIDDIRDLIEQTKYNPSMGRYKIFIIDEVHMLTKEAFNALLKTLEEPPERVKFILATTDPLLVPATILSRTQHFRFKKIPHKLVVNHIANILQYEGVSYEPEALEVIARSGEGSLRDTLTLLDQAILYGGNSVGAQSTISMLGIINPEILETFFLSILQRNEIKTQEIVELMREYECEMIIDEMMIFLKDKALSNHQHFPPLLLNRFFSVLAQAKTLLTLNSNSEFVLLLCIMKMREALKLRDISSYIQDLEQKINIPHSDNIQTPQIQTPNAVGLQDSSTSQEVVQNNNHPESEPRGEKEFVILKQRIYDRSYALGELFEKNFIFCSCIRQDLTLQSRAVGQEREELAKNWKFIKELIKECFGEEMNIIFASAQEERIQEEQTPQAVSQISQEVLTPQETQVIQNKQESQYIQEEISMPQKAQIVSQPHIQSQEVHAQPHPQQNQPQQAQTIAHNSEEIIERNQSLFSTLEEHLGVNLSDVKIIQND